MPTRSYAPLHTAIEPLNLSVTGEGILKQQSSSDSTLTRVTNKISRKMSSMASRLYESGEKPTARAIEEATRVYVSNTGGAAHRCR